MANVSQSGLRATGISRTDIIKSRAVSPQPSQTITPIPETIEAQREEISRTSQELEEAKKQAEISQKTLRTGTLSRSQIAGIKKYKESLAIAQGDLAQIQADFEKQVALQKSINSQVDYEGAWKQAWSAFNKGRAGDYIYFMEDEARKDPYIAAVRNYSQQLIELQRKGELTPSKYEGISWLEKNLPSEAAKIKAFKEEKLKLIKEVEKVGIKTVGKDLEKLQSDVVSLIEKGELQVEITGTKPTEYSISRPAVQPVKTTGDIKKELFGAYYKEKPEEFLKPDPFLQAVDRSNQVYNSALKAYVEKEPFPTKSTVKISPPTFAEQAKIKEAAYKGSFTGITEPLVKTGKAAAKAYEEKVVRPFVKDASWFKWYEEKVVKPYSERFIQPGLKKSGELFEKGIEITPVLKDIAKAKKNIEKMDPEALVKIGMGKNIRLVPAKELQGTGLYEFGKKVFLGEVEQSFTGVSKALGASEETARGIGKGVKLTTEFAPYIIPGVYASDVGVRAGESAIGGTFGGEKNIVEFIRKNPIEVAFVTGMAAVKGYKFLRTAGTKNVIYDPKYKEYLQEEFKKVQLEAERKKIQKTIKETGTKLKGTNLKGDQRFTLKKSQIDNRLAMQKDVPTGIWKGKVQEVHNVGKLKGKVFTGTSVYNSNTGIYKETVHLTGDLNKVTIIDKFGKGTVTITKGNKVVVKVPIKNANIPDLALETNKLKLEKYVTSPERKAITRTVEKGEKGLTKLKEKIIDQRTYGIGKEKAMTVKSGVSKKTGIRKVEEFGDEIQDFIRIQPKVQVTSAKIKGVSSKVKIKQTPQQIAFGSADDVTKQLKGMDKSYFMKRGEKELLIKKTLPKTDRFISRAGKQRVTFTIGDPKLEKLSTPLVTGKGVGSLRDLEVGRYQITMKKGKSVVEKINTEKEFFSKSFKKGDKGAIKFTVEPFKDVKGKQVVHIDFVKARKGGKKIGEELISDVEKLSEGRKVVLEDASNIKGYYKRLKYKETGEGGFFTEYSKVIPKSDTLSEATKEATLKITNAAKKSGNKLVVLTKDVAKDSKNVFKVLKPEKAIGSLKIAKAPLNVIGLAKTGIYKVGAIVGSGLSLASAIASKTLNKEKVKERTDTKSRIDVKTEQGTKTDQGQATDQATDTARTTKTVTTQKKASSTTTQIQRPTTTTTTNIVTPGVTSITRPSMVRTPQISQIDIKQRKIPERKKELSLTKEKAYYIPEAKRNNQWVKLSQTGLTEEAAKGRGARAVDLTVAGRFRIRRVGKGTDKIIDNYFAYNKDKFRDYKISKGKKIPITNIWIEKKGQARIDTPTEKQGLTLAKFIKKQNWIERKGSRTKPNRTIKGRI